MYFIAVKEGDAFMGEEQDNVKDSRRPTHSNIGSNDTPSRPQHSNLRGTDASISQYTRREHGNIAMANAQILTENGDLDISLPGAQPLNEEKK